MTEKVVGILGGMGPEATIDLMNRVIKATPAEDDIDHIRMVVDNNPKVPSRIKALIEGNGPSPGPCLQEMARKLEAWGVDFLAMPCNTAHFYHQEIQNAVSIPVLDMISLTADAIVSAGKDIKTVGLIASTAVINLKIYKEALAAKNISLMAPGIECQDPLMSAIKTIKTCRYGSREIKATQETARSLVQNGAQALLVACTELSILSGDIKAQVPIIDSSQVLAQAIISTARKKSC